METLKEIPPRLERVLKKSLRYQYQLGWIDSSLNPTSEGFRALNEHLYDEYQNILGIEAEKKVKKIKAEQK